MGFKSNKMVVYESTDSRFRRKEIAKDHLFRPITSPLRPQTNFPSHEKGL
jgi:hypothetical protein